MKAVHAYDVCGYCDLCSGYLQPSAKRLDTSAESRLCPTGAIARRFVEDPYYEYTIDERLLHRLREVREGLHRVRQRLAVPPDPARPVRELQRLLRGPPAARPGPSAGSAPVTPYLLKGKGRNG